MKHGALIFACVIFTATLFGQAATAPPQSSNASEAAKGKEIFAARCAKCHNEDAAKKLPDGSTLLARLAKSKNPQARLATRVKNEQELRDVFAYLEPLITRSAAGPETGR